MNKKTVSKDVFASFLRFKRYFNRYYNAFNSSGGTVFYRVVRKQVREGKLPKDFLNIIEDQKRETQKMLMRKYREQKIKK